MSKWRGVLLGGGIALALAGGSMWLGAAPGASGAGEATLSMAPGTSNVSLGAASFELQANVSNVNNLGAYELTVAFDNETLELISIVPTQFLRSTGRQVQCVTTGSSVANQYGAFKHTCSTYGIIEDGVGTAGPDAPGTLATVKFRPKAVGTTYITFEGMGVGNAYQVEPPSAANQAGELGKTGLSQVEVCTTDDDADTPHCAPHDVAVTPVDAVVTIFDPNGPTPTGVPATPTPRPTQSARDVQATVQAVLTPSARLSTPRSGVAGADAGGANRGSGTRSGSGAAAGANSGIGPDGAPIAGYGPQERESSEWPQRAGIALAVIGGAAVAGGMAARRRWPRQG